MSFPEFQYAFVNTSPEEEQKKDYESNYEHYKNSSARTDFHEFPGRSHLLIAQEGWEEIADYVSSWLDQQAIG